MSRHHLAGLAAACLAVTFVAGPSASPALVGAQAPSDTVASSDTSYPGDTFYPTDTVDDPSRAAWMSTGSAIFAVNTDDQTVRFRGCDTDTGRVTDPRMRVTHGVATGRVVVDGTSYAYRVPLEGRRRGQLEVRSGEHGSERLTGEVVTNPMPPTDPSRAEQLEPLTDRLQEIVDASTANPAGVVVRDLSGRYGDGQVGVNVDFRPKAASIIKLWILTELLRQIDCGLAAFTDEVLVLPSDVVDGTGELQHETFPQEVTLYRLAQYMIKFSDNTATNVLIDYLGGFAPVNDLSNSMNQFETVLARKMLDTEAAMRGEENYTSPDDVISLLGAVWDGDVLSPTSKQIMISFMLEQTINTKIPAALPPGVPVAHKTGELPDASHDVGYYLIPGTEVAVAFLTSGPEPTGADTVRELARAVYDYLQIPTDG